MTKTIRRMTAPLLVFTVWPVNAYCAGAGAEGKALADLTTAAPQDSAAMEIAVPDEPARAGRDLTGDFTRTWDSADLKLGEKETAELRKYKVLLVRGFMTGAYVRPIHIFGRDIWTGPYFNDQMELLKELGPVAEYIKGDKTLSAAMAALLGHFGGTIDSLASLTPGAREQFLSSNRGPVQEVLAGVNMISFASWKENEHNGLDTLLKFPRDHMLKRGLDNDGLVPAESAVLPGSDYIKLRGADHMVTVMNVDKVLKFDRRRFTKTLPLMILSR